MKLRIENKPQRVQELAREWKKTGLVGLVPTMGYLHEGHLSLARMAKTRSQKTIVSLFVNPKQFGPNEDLSRYPRSFEEDVQKLEALGVDLLFAPRVEDIYPDGFCTMVNVIESTQHLCGQSRPGHFEGVATVVIKLLNSCLCDIAVFGEKDFQQLRIIERMVLDLNVPVQILAHPTVREADGLAFSSRNRNLTVSDRKWAAEIPKVGEQAVLLAQNGFDQTVGELLKHLDDLFSQTPLVKDYLEIAEEGTLVPAAESAKLSELQAPRLFIAMKIAETRLIDNFSLAPLGRM